MNTYLITGVAGFIGSQLAESLLIDENKIIGIDDLSEPVQIKKKRLSILNTYSNFRFFQANIKCYYLMAEIMKQTRPLVVFHLAAKTGIRRSVDDPREYVNTNIIGTFNILEAMKECKVKRLIFSSSSSVYGNNKLPWKENYTLKPNSPYAATKASAELLCHAYHSTWNIDVTVLRYFTVYGQWGRMNMCVGSFVENILNDKSITVFGDGEQKRDFTFIDDIISATVKAVQLKGFQVFNVGTGKATKVSSIIRVIENLLHKKAKINYKKAHKADALVTLADISKARKVLGWQAKTCIEEGLTETVMWASERRK